LIDINVRKIIENSTIRSKERGRRKVDGEEDPDVTLSLNNLGIAYKDQGNLPKPLTTTPNPLR